MTLVCSLFSCSQTCKKLCVFVTLDHACGRGFGAAVDFKYLKTANLKIQLHGSSSESSISAQLNCHDLYLCIKDFT